MYYRGDPRWEPEFTIDLTDGGEHEKTYYTHRRCWLEHTNPPEEEPVTLNWEIFKRGRKHHVSPIG